MNSNPLNKMNTRSMPSGLRYTLYGVGIAVVIIGSLVITKVFQFGAMAAAGANMVMPPAPVNTYLVQERQWQPHVSSVGTIKAVQGTMIRAESDGIVRSIKFTAGASAQAGEELVRLDTEVEETQLRAAEAQADGARLTYNRAKELIGKGSVSKSEFNTAEVALKQAQAQVAKMRAMINKKIISAPFAGKLGIRSISVGNYLNKGAEIVQLYSLNPVFVEFSLPQQRVGELIDGLLVTAISDAYPDEKFTGTVTAFNPSIDLTTRNISVQATLDNSDGRLRPGMFVGVEMLLTKAKNVLFIPVTAVLHSPVGDAVFVLEEGEADGNKVILIQQQLVTLSARQGDFVIVSEGLSVGQQIVSAGVFKLRAGMPVVVDNTLAPDFKLAPKPDNT